MFERILVPLDGSKRAEQILDQVARILKREDSEILLLRVIEPGDAGGLVTGDGIHRDDQESGLKYLHGVARRFADKAAKIHARLAEGVAEDVILETAKTEGATLIAMTTHGRTGLERWTMGSVAEKVARASNVPVLLVRSFQKGTRDPLPAEERAFRRILVPIDGSPTSMSVIGAAEKFAALYGSHVMVLHVTPPYAPPGAMLPGMEASFPITRPEPIRSEADPATEAAADRFRHAGLYVTRQTVEGDPASAILDLSVDRGMDLIAIGTHGRTGLSRWALGSVAERVLRSAEVPLLLVRTPSAERVKSPIPPAVHAL